MYKIINNDSITIKSFKLNIKYVLNELNTCKLLRGVILINVTILFIYFISFNLISHQPYQVEIIILICSEETAIQIKINVCL